MKPEADLRKAVNSFIQVNFETGAKVLPIQYVCGYFEDEGLTERFVVQLLDKKRYTIRTRGSDGQRVIVLLDRMRYITSPIFHDEDKDASIVFGLKVSLSFVESDKDKKIVPLGINVHWHFWTWRQVITIFL